MKYSIAIYCPDQHITYNLRTLEKVGVGGGITARIRIAHALAKEGHNVSLFINCPKDEILQGVQYRKFQNFDYSETDLFIASTSGGDLSLESVIPSRIRAKLKLLMIHGVNLPNHINPEDYDYFYVLSNFVRKVAIDNWKIPPQKIFVTHRGVQEKNTIKPDKLERNPYRLVYMGHPSKGLDTSIAIFRQLRQINPKFSLHIFGGNRLWGGIDTPIPTEPGLFIHGLIGQKQLTKAIRTMSFSLNLQAREEPFGMVVTESQQAGCIVLASHVGAYPEIIQNGYNGFLIPGLHTEKSTREITARLVIDLLENEDYMRYIRLNAIKSPITWKTVANVWQSHWERIFESSMNRKANSLERVFSCSICDGNMLPLSDGLHCIDCGYFQCSSQMRINKTYKTLGGINNGALQ